MITRWFNYKSISKQDKRPVMLHAKKRFKIGAYVSFFSHATGDNFVSSPFIKK